MFNVSIEGKISLPAIQKVAKDLGLSTGKNSKGLPMFFGNIESDAAFYKALDNSGIEYREHYQYGPEKVWVACVPLVEGNPFDDNDF